MDENPVPPPVFSEKFSVCANPFVRDVVSSTPTSCFARRDKKEGDEDFRSGGGTPSSQGGDSGHGTSPEAAYSGVQEEERSFRRVSQGM